MKHSFNCFYDLTETTELNRIWKDSDTIFIFDTNVLLSLYSFQPESRKDFLKVLSSIQDRIWIPFHVGLEFQKNRLTVIKNRRSTFNDLNKDVDKLSDTLTFDKKPFTTLQNKFSLKKNYLNVFNKLNESLKKIDESFAELENELKICLKELKDEIDITDKEKIFVNSKDFIRDEIDDLFTVERIGKNIFNTIEKLNSLYKEGNDRYKNKIPPGYEDEDKGDQEFYFEGVGYKNKFGDLIIFKQIIDFCKERSIKNVIFISEDIKKDWRHIEDQEGDKILGARPELKRELNREAGVENFLIYQIEDFVKKTNEYLDIKIEPKTLKSIKLSLEEDKHQKSFENKVLEAQKMQELYERVADDSALFKAKAKVKAALEAQKMQELYERVADNSTFSKAVLDAQKMQELYGRVADNSTFSKAVLDAQKMQELYGRVADNSAFSKAVLDAQKMQELYGRVADDSAFSKAALEAQKMQELYGRMADDSAFSKAALEAQKMQELYGRVADDSAFSKAALEAQKMQKFYSYENFIKKVKDDQDDE